MKKRLFKVKVLSGGQTTNPEVAKFKFLVVYGADSRSVYSPPNMKELAGTYKLQSDFKADPLKRLKVFSEHDVVASEPTEALDRLWSWARGEIDLDALKAA